MKAMVTIAAMAVAVAPSWASAMRADAALLFINVASSNGDDAPDRHFIPRFASLKANRVNMRRGPGTGYPVSWIFLRKGLPVEIIAEYGHWRRVRGSEGKEGWVYYSLLTNRRTALVMPWQRGKGRLLALLSEPANNASIIARLEAGVIGELLKCAEKWCKIAVLDYKGWVPRDMLWGVYPDEEID
ncbi:MAG: SH3 domain-containing protein [Hyphomicrobiales bacterium]